MEMITRLTFILHRHSYLCLHFVHPCIHIPIYLVSQLWEIEKLNLLNAVDLEQLVLLDQTMAMNKAKFHKTELKKKSRS